MVVKEVPTLAREESQTLRSCVSAKPSSLSYGAISVPDTDVPAGDIGVGGREVAYMYGMYKKLARENTGTFTGKGIEFGGSLIRPEATGYGNVYFLLQMLKTRNIDIKDKVVCVSGSGNVAQYTVEKLISLGAKVITMSDSDGYIYDPDGIDREKLDYIMELKNLYRGRIREYAEQYGCKYVQGARPWGEKCDIAMPSATQNELNGDDAKTLLLTVASPYPRVLTCLLHQKLSTHSLRPRSFTLRVRPLTQVVYPFPVLR